MIKWILQRNNMFIKFAAKYGKILINVIVIAAIVVAVFLLNPWDIFGDGLKLNPTANNVSAIKKIGQLITAEYYGETIATFDQSKLNLMGEDSINARANLIFQKLKQDVLYAHAKNLLDEKSDEKGSVPFIKKLFRWASNPKKGFSDYMDNVIKENLKLLNDPLSKTVIMYYLKGSSNINKRKIEKIEKKDIEDALWLMMQEIKSKTEGLSDKQFDTYMQEGLPMYDNQVFSDFYYDKLRGENEQELKKELAIIGRGWVKAGIDFGTLDENNLMFDKEQGVVHLFGLHPEILNADINPWFIPEKKIPGFQIIEANRKVNFEDAKTVKKYCIQKLRKMAIEAGILEQAERQAKESLKSFLSIITGIEVKEVHFYYDVFSVLSQELVADEFISYEEARMLDTLISHQIDTIIRLDGLIKNYTTNQRLKDVKINQLKLAIKRFKKCKYEGREQNYNRLAYLVYRVAADSILTPSELDELSAERWDLETMLNTHSAKKGKLQKKFIEKEIWYEDTLDFINEYNDAIDRIVGNVKAIAGFENTAIPIKKWKNVKNQYPESFLFNITMGEDSVYLTLLDSIYNKNNLVFYKYPLHIKKDWKELIKSKENFMLPKQNKPVGIRKGKLLNNSLATIYRTRNTDPIRVDTIIKISHVLPNTIKWETKVQADSTKIYTEMAIGDTITFSDRKKNNTWEIDPITSNDADVNAYLKYIVNYYETEVSGWSFTKASKKFKKGLDTESIKLKTGKWVRSMQSKFSY